MLTQTKLGLVVAVKLGNAVVNAILGIAVATGNILVGVALQAEVSILALLRKKEIDKSELVGRIYVG